MSIQRLPELSIGVLRIINELSGEAASCETSIAIGDLLVRSINQLIPVDLFGWNEFKHGDFHDVVNFRLSDGFLDTVIKHIDQVDQALQFHPCLSHLAEKPDEQAVLTISDFMADCDYHNHILYRDAYSLLAGRYQACIVAGVVGDSFSVLLFNRDHSDFTSHEREIISGLKHCLTPHLHRINQQNFLNNQHTLLRNLLADILQIDIPINLPPRLLEMIPLIASGLSNRTIADLRGISIKTVEHYCTGIYEALGLENRRQLITALHASTESK